MHTEIRYILTHYGDEINMSFIKKHGVTLILSILMTAGAALLAYPAVSNLYNNMVHDRAVGSYSAVVSSLDSSTYEAILNSAKDYNERIAESNFLWAMDDAAKKDYNEQLNLTDDGGIGYIEIPRIGQKLVIYHGTDEKTLEKGVGHVEGTSLPIGGDTSHCVLSGHRGLPSAKLFSDLDKLVVGDYFCITVLDYTLTYEVDQIRIVNPDDFTKFTMEKGKDMVTLVTCTPYGVNSHRLLVRGHRIANMSGDAHTISEALVVEPKIVMIYIAVPIIIVLFAAVMIDSSRKSGYARLLKKVNIEEHLYE